MCIRDRGIMRDLTFINEATAQSRQVPHLRRFCLRKLYDVSDDKSGLVDNGDREAVLSEK